MATVADRDTRIHHLEQRIAVLEQVCSEAYQLAGTVGAPEKALDNLAAAAQGEPIPHETFLPVSEADCDACRADDTHATPAPRPAAARV